MYGLYAFTRSIICQLYSATFFGDWATEIPKMVIFRRHVGPVNHQQLRKYFTSTHTIPTGTLPGPGQIDDKEKCILMHPILYLSKSSKLEDDTS